MAHAVDIRDQDTGEIRSVVVRSPQDQALLATVPESRAALVKSVVVRSYPQITDDEFELFVAICNRTGLDPLQKQIYAIARWDSRVSKYAMAIQVGIDGFRLQAERTHEYQGQDGPYWCGEDGQWVDVWLASQAPAAARVGVRRKGHPDFTYGVVTYREYCQKTKDGKPMGLWSTMPANQLAKCAESQAIRKLFPSETAQISIAEELPPDDVEYARRETVAHDTIQETEARTGRKIYEIAQLDDSYVDGTPRTAGSPPPRPTANQAPCDFNHYQRTYFQMVKGSPLADDAMRARLIADYTHDATESLTELLTRCSEAKANAFIAHVAMLLDGYRRGQTPSFAEAPAVAAPVASDDVGSPSEASAEERKEEPFAPCTPEHRAELEKLGQGRLISPGVKRQIEATNWETLADDEAITWISSLQP